MPHSHEDIQAHRYYWEYVKRFGKECAERFKRDFYITVVAGMIALIVAWFLKDRDNTRATILTLGAVAGTFLLCAVQHLFHVTLLLFRERYHPETGGIRVVGAGYGVLGIVLLFAMLCGSGLITYGLLLRRTPDFVVNFPVPKQPIIEQNTDRTKSEHDNPTPKNSPPQTGTPQPNQPNPTVQTPPPQNAQQPPPVTWLDRMVQENRGLTSFDREKLSQDLYAADKLLKQTQAVGYKVSTEFTKISNDRQSAALAKNVEEHIKALKDLEPAATDQYNALMKFQTDSQYFEHQTEYIFGDNPFNGGVSLMQNALAGLTADLTRWSEISNRDKPEILLLAGDFEVPYQEKLGAFLKWANVSLLRCNQMRQSLDPNRTVDPLPTGAVAPAPAMFTSISRL
jgi:hypothetical protein